jgi:transcriptional regulator with XRE-family HTH domain
MSMNSLDGTEIRSYRESLGMSIQELADIIGVKMSAVVEWENGTKDVPQEKVASVRKALEMNGESLPEFGHGALLRQLGKLAKQRREEIGLGRVPFAKEAGMGSDSTVRDFEFGRRLMSGTNQRRIEKALGWRLGVIEDMMRMVDRKASTITMEELDAEDSVYIAAQGGIKGAALLTNEELLAELGRRLSQVPSPMEARVRDMFGLAASTNAEHLEDAENGDED